MAIPTENPPPLYRPSPIKRARRTKNAIETIKIGLYQILAEQHPATVRGVFYQAVSRGLVRKTEQDYKGTVGRLLSEMRRDGDLPYGWIADQTRWMRKPDSYSGLESMLHQTARLYRRDLWESQPDYVEVWLEKDALAGVVYEVTERWDVPLMVTRGYPSLSFLHSAAETMLTKADTVTIYYLGDHDPSGVHIPQWVQEQLTEMVDGEVYIDLIRLAVNPGQVEEYGFEKALRRLFDEARGRRCCCSCHDRVPPPDVHDLQEASR